MEKTKKELIEMLKNSNERVDYYSKRCDKLEESLLDELKRVDNLMTENETYFTMLIKNGIDPKTGKRI